MSNFVKSLVEEQNKLNKAFYDIFNGDVALKFFFPFELKPGTFSWVDYSKDFVVENVELLKKELIDKHKIFESFSQFSDNEGIYLSLNMSVDFNGISSKYDSIVEQFENKAQQNKENYTIKEILMDYNKEYFFAREAENVFRLTYGNLLRNSMFEDLMPLIDLAECNMSEESKIHLDNIGKKRNNIKP